MSVHSQQTYKHSFDGQVVTIRSNRNKVDFYGILCKVFVVKSILTKRQFVCFLVDKIETTGGNGHQLSHQIPSSFCQAEMKYTHMKNTQQSNANVVCARWVKCGKSIIAYADTISFPFAHSMHLQMCPAGIFWGLVINALRADTIKYHS